MEPNKIKKIVVIGPESTGKSTLCELLAQHYQTEWCSEFARAYLLTNGTNYTFDDLAHIAKGQLSLEDELTAQVSGKWEVKSGEWGVGELGIREKELGSGVKELRNGSDGQVFINAQSLLAKQNAPIIFLDTDMYVMKVWCEYVFGKCHTFILEEIVHRQYDLYLLCNIDLPWVKDELREYPDEKNRQELYNIYKDILINQSTAWVEISGNYEQRLASAIQAINSTFSIS